MTELRRSTVYDYSDLRLHPDGTRVHQMEKNLRPTTSQFAVQVARSNWIARDAAGWGAVPKHRSKKQGALLDNEEDTMHVEEDDDDEQRKDDDDEDGNASESGQNESSRNRKRPPDHRKSIFRRRFLKNEDYLVVEDEPSSKSSVPADDNAEFGDLVLPPPSPDLLKCINRFAAEFYTERGQLVNSSKLYRQERKARKERRRRANNGEDEGDPDSESESESEPSSQSSSSDSSSNKNGESQEGKTRKRKGSRRKKKVRRQPKRQRIGDLYTDMYKMFDGSSLMALGMLVQEYVADLLKPRIPETWESEVRAAYTRPWPDNPGGHGEQDGHAKSLSGAALNETGSGLGT